MDHQVLVCVTTCKRIDTIKLYLLPYIEYCNQNSNTHFLLAQDGNEASYVDFCNEFDVPMISSDEREGVGLSKNRVLSQFPDYDHYFFLDDDVELYDSSVFELVIKTALDLQLDHLCITPFHQTLKEFKLNDLTIQQGNKGGGYFNYFSGKGLKTVGGWHDEFAKWKRYGHSEHSMRYINAELATYGFNSILEATRMVILHDPVHVTKPLEDHNENEFSLPEEKIMNQKLKFYPVNTISPFHFNGFEMGTNEKVTAFLAENKNRYPLSTGKDNKKAMSSYYFFLSQNSKSRFGSLKYLFLTVLKDFKNPQFKHWVKVKLKSA